MQSEMSCAKKELGIDKRKRKSDYVSFKRGFYGTNVH